MRRIRVTKVRAGVASAVAVTLAAGGFAFAQWMTTGSESEQLQAGTGPAITLTTTTSGATISGDSITFPATTGFQPSFVTADLNAIYTNQSGAPAQEETFAITTSPGVDPASVALNAGLSVCITGMNKGGGIYPVIWKGTLAGAVAAGNSLYAGKDLNAGVPDYFDVYIGAGAETTSCASQATGTNNANGPGLSSWPTLPGAAAGGSDSFGLVMTFQAG